MSLPRLWTTSSQELDPFRAMRREMENAFRAFDQSSSSPNIGAGAPAISVAETNDAFEVTAELPGVDEKDINVSLDENQLVISGEKKAESTREEKDWHVEERSYGSFYRSMSLPFEPEDGAVDAHFDKGVLHLTIKKPAKATKVTKTIISRQALHRALTLTRPLRRTRPLSPLRLLQAHSEAGIV